MQYYESLGNKVNVKFVAAKTGVATKVLLPKIMSVDDVTIAWKWGFAKNRVSDK